MKKYITFLVLFFGAWLCVSAQADSTVEVPAEYPGIDTLKFYNVHLSARTTNGQTSYWVNERPVSKEVYLHYQGFWDNIDKCRPCYRKTYDENEKLVSEGPRYTDCVIGKWIEYYPDGKIKLIAQYKVNDTGKWKKVWERGYCSVQDGEWIYYDESGKVVKTEHYKNGKSVK